MSQLRIIFNLQTMQQNTNNLKLFRKIFLFLKLDFKELDINKVEFYTYFAI